MGITNKLIDWAERGILPDWAIRLGIRKLCRKRLSEVDLGDDASNRQRLEKLVQQFRDGPIAPVPEKANEQHYEVPAELYLHTLGPRLKYSCCWYPEGNETLAVAEDAALEESCRRAELADGMDVLELGCGWGSLTLWMAEQYPSSQIMAVSNSNSQREFIMNRARERGLSNVRVITCDMNDFQAETRFDRVVSVEMFEHMRNYEVLLRRVGQWLRPTGKLFVHIFCHRELAYEFHDRGDADWMSRYFFSGGIMPSRDLLSNFQDDLTLERQWDWNGEHYQRTCEQWLATMDRNKAKIMPVLIRTYGEDEASRWFYRWRMFYLSCSELFGMDGGDQWFVTHYLFENAAKEKSAMTEQVSEKSCY